MSVDLSIAGQLSGKLKNIQNVSGNLSAAGRPTKVVYTETGTDDYEKLINKPSINGVTVEGDKTSRDYNIYGNAQELSMQEIDNIIFGGN